MAFHLAPYLAKSLPGIGVFGSVVGGAAALAKNARLVESGQITQQDAAIDTAKETVGAGLATVFSAAVAGAVGGGLAVSLGVAVAAGVAGKYAYDRGVEFLEGRLVVKDDQAIEDAEILNQE